MRIIKILKRGTKHIWDFVDKNKYKKKCGKCKSKIKYEKDDIKTRGVGIRTGYGMRQGYEKYIECPICGYGIKI